MQHSNYDPAQLEVHKQPFNMGHTEFQSQIAAHTESLITGPIVKSWVSIKRAGRAVSLEVVVLLLSHSVMSNSLRPMDCSTPGFLSSTTSWSLLGLMSIESVMPSNISSSVAPFSSCLQSSPASESFPMSQLFASGDQSIGATASASVPPMNIQGWFSFGWT